MNASSPRRLTLTPLGHEHLADYIRLIAQPEVHRHLSRAADIAADPEGQGRRIVGMSEEQWRSRGYGPFAILETETARFIGRGGLLWVAHLDAVEINYMFDPSSWGKGYATEVARVFLELGFRKHGFDRMVATTNPQNIASRRVLEKVGFSFVAEKDLGGRLVEVHEITREAWLAGTEPAVPSA